MALNDTEPAATTTTQKHHKKSEVEMMSSYFSEERFDLNQFYGKASNSRVRSLTDTFILEDEDSPISTQRKFKSKTMDKSRKMSLPTYRNYTKDVTEMNNSTGRESVGISQSLDAVMLLSIEERHRSHHLGFVNE